MAKKKLASKSEFDFSKISNVVDNLSKKSMIIIENLENERSYISTGVHILDALLSKSIKNGGVPKNRITIFAGPPQTGKSYLTLATALKQVFEQKKFKKLIVIKPPVESSDTLGFLPGNVEEKMFFHWRPLFNLLLKLNDLRPCNKLFIKDENFSDLNPRFCEFIPINFLRGDNIDNAFVVISEAQNITRNEMRTILTRMGENCKVVLEGDVTQVDHPNCNMYNNGLNWVVKLLSGKKHYAHLIMNCKKTRGLICDMVTEAKL